MQIPLTQKNMFLILILCSLESSPEVTSGRDSS